MKDFKDLTAKDIKATLLVNGDEIIGPIDEHKWKDKDGSVVQNESDHITIAKPAKFIPMDQNKMMVVSLFMYGDFETCDIKNIHIISTVQARQEIAEAWLERFADKKSIIKPDGGIVLP